MRLKIEQQDGIPVLQQKFRPTEHLAAMTSNAMQEEHTRDGIVGVSIPAVYRCTLPRQKCDGFKIEPWRWCWNRLKGWRDQLTTDHQASKYTDTDAAQYQRFSG